MRGSAEEHFLAWFQNRAVSVRTSSARCADWFTSIEEGNADPITMSANNKITRGRQTFRFDTFGDEGFWGGQLQLHKAVEGASFGGVGRGLTPRTALNLGLKVDVDALPQQLSQKIVEAEVCCRPSPGLG